SEAAAGDTGLPALTLTVEHGDEAPFTYTLWPQAHPTPTFRMNTSDQDDTYFRVEVLLAEGTQGYDVTGYAKEQLTADGLDQYERHLLFLHASSTPTHETEQSAAGAPCAHRPPQPPCTSPARGRRRPPAAPARSAAPPTGRSSPRSPRRPPPTPNGRSPRPAA